MAANLVVNWETFSKIEKDGFEIYEIEVSEKKASEIESNLFQNQLKYELIAIKKGTEIHSYLVEAYTSLNHTLFANSIENLSNFTGTLNVFQLDGTSVGQLVIFNGHSKNTTEKSVIEPLNEVINFYSYKQSLTNKAPECVETYIVYTYALENTNHYSSVTVGNYTQLTYRNTTQETIITTSFMNTPYPCGTNGDSYYILYRTTINRDVIDEVIDPCEKLKTQYNNLTYKAKIDVLKTQTGKTKENGYAQTKDGSFTTLTANGSDAVTLPRDINRIGYMHTHLDSYQKTNSDGDLIDVFPIKIFSPEDVKQFLILVVNAQNYGIPISDTYGVMVSSAGTYQLGFTGNAANINVKTSTINWDESLNEIYKTTILENGLEKGLLKFLKDKIGIDGIDLYKIEETGNQKITLDINGEKVTINCN
ncbi:hypothetical protein AB3G33_02560 [Flavobacterium sp. WC2421]|uniref:hypothetical protein n=1 Tax=Flavobacterium sp. WC2421 TaxID=3234138 RepID=UPI003467863C